MVVNGKNVVAYGVFVEHIVDGHMLMWNGEAGQPRGEIQPRTLQLSSDFIRFHLICNEFQWISDF